MNCSDGPARLAIWLSDAPFGSLCGCELQAIPPVGNDRNELYDCRTGSLMKPGVRIGHGFLHSK